jgi:hypothetical protein
MSILTGQEAKDTLDELLKHSTPFPEPYVVGYYFDIYTGIWTGFDNRTGDCWVESFKSDFEVRRWVHGKDNN